MKNFIYILLLASINAHSKIITIFDTNSQSVITHKQFISSIPNTGFVALGEIHNIPSIQNAQAKIINDIVENTNNQNDFTIMWEFLNYLDDQRDRREFHRLKTGEIDAATFIKNTAGKQNLSYSTIFETGKNLGAEVFGINAYRKTKSKLIQGGLDAIDPRLIPPNMEVGGDNYWSRFEAIMGGHVPSDKLERYFLAQCYTDSVMSYMANLKHKRNLSFIIAGAFHTDYFDGTISRLKKLNNESITTVSLRDINDLSDEEITELLKTSTRYGVIADFIILTK